MARTAEPVQTPNQSFNEDIIKNPTIIINEATNEPKGRTVSGRTWKRRVQKRASSLITSNAANAKSKSWEKKQMERKLRQQLKEKEAEMKEAKRAAILAKKERRLENEKNRMENEFKLAQRQAQKLNLNKVGTTMKALNKKQLRMIKKTRMNTKTGVVEYVPAYAK
mmetsp:Transcript_5518/g.7294  ORF Transcript_5518/g.7294 Transcript_5518/m.7294 type:complete len:166 (+) Transcript_5518:96-593(+)